ncbi:ATP-binding cassette domain-containing protein [Pantoea sp. BAV 3049]|uniref:ATP-binding cassette domain-containing protein n=1 Tax=Pantoea sp. BAV 3049 TaxID=2654188 RepID=UPI001E5B7ADF|nr:ATP-binding cassette domain-containing protein [Pantoea sp. BAV 3049]
MRPMILFNQVNKWYGDYQALTNLSAEIKSGEVVVVCGPSGSGKSTLIRTVNRLEPIEQGQILEKASPERFFSNPQHERAKRFLSDLRQH